MDMDSLKPETVPVSPDTTLWFEFLLHPSLLEQHLSKPSPDPAPLDLIIKFVTISSNKKYSDQHHKILNMKILTLKIAAYLKWDLDTFERKLPFMTQFYLMENLIFITSNMVIEIPLVPEFTLDSISDQLLFAIVCYHRWLLRAIFHKACNKKKQKQQFKHIPDLDDGIYISNLLIEEIIIKLKEYATNSIKVLNAALQLDVSPKMISFASFQMLTEKNAEDTQNWNNMQNISPEEFRCQIHYDLAIFHMLQEEYQSAKQHISKARHFFLKLNISNLLYCKVQKEYLDGCCLACEIFVDGVKPTLTHQLLIAIRNQKDISNILEILKTDNITREIQQVYRDNLQLNIQSGLVNRKIIVAHDMLLQIQCLNLIRKVLDNDVIVGDYVAEIKAAGTEGLNMLFWAINNALESASITDKKRIARFLLYLVLTSDIDKLAFRIINETKYVNLFDVQEFYEVQKKAKPEDFDVPKLLVNDDWGIPCVIRTQKSRRKKVDELEYSLILTYDANKIKDILNNLNNISWRKPKEINPNWKVPTSFQSIIQKLDNTRNTMNSFLQDYTYILLAKSCEMTMSKDFIGAKLLLKALKDKLRSEKDNLTYKLYKMVNWEILFIDICDCLHTWPAMDVCNSHKLVEKCKKCLTTSHSTDEVLPRQDIIDYCTSFLLNMKEWDYLKNIESRKNNFEFVAAISKVCQNIVNHKGNHKFPREAWDMVLAEFEVSRDHSKKYSSSGNSSLRKPMTSLKETLNKFREMTSLTVVISLLSRLYNDLKNEPSLELYSQYLSLWSGSVLNLKSYNVKSIGEFLFQLLIQALKYYPNNVHWLRLMADLNFVLGYYNSAMKHYLKAIMIASDLFNQPTPKSMIDDLVYRRMIKCCAEMQCYTQATILCQFLEELDYELAFQMADKKSCASTDATDSYYHCIWDITLLEYLIHLHSKRGEHKRKKFAIKNIGLLELNSNNNEDIKKEAANSRKRKFLNALSKQYVY